MNAVTLIVSELNAAGAAMRDCAAGVPCNLAADLRRHDAEEIRREAEIAAIDERVFTLLETDCNPLAPFHPQTAMTASDAPYGSSASLPAPLFQKPRSYVV